MEVREKLDKIKALWGLRTDEDLANKLEVPKETINSWIKRKKIPEKWELKIGQMNNIGTNHNPDLVNIPYFKDACVSAGRGVINHESDVSAIQMSKVFLAAFFGITSYFGLEAVNVIGDSMEPSLQDGDIALVIKKTDFREGAAYICRYHGEFLVKRVQQNPKTKSVKLISDNNKYDPFIVEDEDLENLELLGRVIGVVSKFR